jgi:long-chain-fatty-acid--CoA ligase ACSBG
MHIYLSQYLNLKSLCRFDEDGFLTITGRIKDLLITAGGENIAPVLIEDNIKNELQNVVSNAMVVGDSKKYLTVLLTLKVQVDPVTLIPTEKLETCVVDWCRSLNVHDVQTIEDFRTSPKNEVCD